MTTETRYFKNASVTVNGLTCFSLAIDTSGTYWSQSRTAIGYLGCTVGIRVWKRNSVGTETEITAGTPVAQVSTSDGDVHVLYNGAWFCPLTSLDATDSIVVRVYAQFASWLQIGTSIFTTEQLGAVSLDHWLWTLYYYLSFVYNESTNRGTVTFDFDGAYQSKIANFTWTTSSVIVVSVGNSVIFVISMISMGKLRIHRNRKRRFIATLK